MARRMVLTGLSSTPSRPITFSNANTHAVLFPHNDVLVITLQIGNCRMSKILINVGNNINIMYGGALDRMEDTPELAQTMINPKTRSHLYEFDGNETQSPGMVSLPMRPDLYNVVTKFYVIDIESSHNAILKRPWIHRIQAILSSYHQLLWYPTPTGTVEIWRDQVMSHTISTIAKKKSGWVTKVTKIASDDDSPTGKK